MNYLLRCFCGKKKKKPDHLWAKDGTGRFPDSRWKVSYFWEKFILFHFLIKMFIFPDTRGRGWGPRPRPPRRRPQPGDRRRHGSAEVRHLLASRGRSHEPLPEPGQLRFFYPFLPIDGVTSVSMCYSYLKGMLDYANYQVWLHFVTYHSMLRGKKHLNFAHLLLLPMAGIELGLPLLQGSVLSITPVPLGLDFVTYFPQIILSCWTISKGQLVKLYHPQNRPILLVLFDWHR